MEKTYKGEFRKHFLLFYFQQMYGDVQRNTTVYAKGLILNVPIRLLWLACGSVCMCVRLRKTHSKNKHRGEDGTNAFSGNSLHCVRVCACVFLNPSLKASFTTSEEHLGATIDSSQQHQQ